MLQMVTRLPLTFLLALSVAVAPVFPAFASVWKNADSQTIHAEHADAHATVTPPADLSQSPCDKHDNCNGYCCATCAQCFTAMVVAPIEIARARSIQTPTVRRFHPHSVVATPHRPPRVLS